MSIIDTQKYLAPKNTKIKLSQWETLSTPYYEDKKSYKNILKSNRQKMVELQKLLYASNEHSLLIIFQAMDAAGKDGAIRHVMSGINPQGCQVFSFKKPSDEELDHDFLWRTNKSLPERGRIGIFNRSYYEETLIVRVHPEILKNQSIPQELIKTERIWQDRFESINDMEKHATRNGTKIVKFFLHLSKDEQRKRFIKRIDDPSKNWKFSKFDIKERGYWDKYQNVYEQTISATSQPESPWYIIPADDKKNARLIISQILLETLSSLDMQYPEQSAERIAELQEIRKKLVK